MKLKASILGKAVAAKRGSSYAHQVAARLEPGQTIAFVDGSQARVLQTSTSSDGFRMRVATAGGERSLSARQFVEMGPVSPAMTRLATFVHRVLSYEAVIDDYIKEAIKAAGLPIDRAMNWSKYLERMYGPILQALTRDESLREDAIRDMVVTELYEKRMLSSDSRHAHFDPNHAQLEGKSLEQKVTAYLISLFKYRKTQVADNVRRSLGVGMASPAGLEPTHSLEQPPSGMKDTHGAKPMKNDLADMVLLDQKNPDIANLEGNDEVSQFLSAFKEHIGETQRGSSAATLNRITDGFASGMNKTEIREGIVGNKEFQKRDGTPLDIDAYNHLLGNWGKFIRTFAKDPASGWSDSPIARMISQSADKADKVKATRPVAASLHLAIGVMEKEDLEDEVEQQLAEATLPPAAVPPASPNVQQQNAIKDKLKTPTLQNGIDPDAPKITIPPELPGVNHTAAIQIEEKDMKTLNKLMARDRMAAAPKKKVTPPALKNTVAPKFASLRRIADQEPQEIGQALGDLSDSFTKMAGRLTALKDNLDLAEAPREASIRQKVAHRNRYAITLRRLATEAPDELAAAIVEFYGQLDEIAGEVENFAGNIGVELGPIDDELGTAEEGGAPVVEEEPLEVDFQDVPGEGEEGKIAGRKQADDGGRVHSSPGFSDDQRNQLIEMLWSNMRRDREHKDRVQTGWGTKTQMGLASSIERILGEEDPTHGLIVLLWESMRKDPANKDRVQTGWGTKTQEGLVACIQRIVREGADPEPEATPEAAAPEGKLGAKSPSGIEMTVVREGDPKLSIVKENGRVLGFIEKWEDDADTTNPYKAFDAITGQGPVRVGTTMKAFYDPNGLKKAIAYLKSFDPSGRPITGSLKDDARRASRRPRIK